MYINVQNVMNESDVKEEDESEVTEKDLLER